jgi:hypothetical protein
MNKRYLLVLFHISFFVFAFSYIYEKADITNWILYAIFILLGMNLMHFIDTVQKK